MSAAVLLMLQTVPSMAALPATVVSPGAEAVSVTVYRDMERDPDDDMELDWLGGRALISETRTIALPAGDADIRFEGVAGGILPVSAIVTGLPGGTIEKNRDARLLSPAALIAGALGRRIHLRRTDRATGRVREQDAEIIAGPEGGVVLRTAGGIEALGCSGLPEHILHDGVPTGLSSRPILSVRTHSEAATSATVRLTYLAEAFDWNADYVAQIAAEGRTLDLFAWLTLANGNGESFTNADTKVVAGTIEQAAQDDPTEGGAPSPELRLVCWPMGVGDADFDDAMPPPPPIAPMAAGEDIIVTAQKRAESVMNVPLAVLVAQQEDLGDLKLYRIPEPVTVAANGQKQVALFTRRAVPFERIHAFRVPLEDETDPMPATTVLRMRNRLSDQLGLPLPAGRVAAFQSAAGRVLRIGEGTLDDVPIGQEVNLDIGESSQVLGIVRRLSRADGEDDDGSGDFLFEISNANPFAVKVEAVIAMTRGRFSGAVRRLPRVNGLPLWKAMVPANGRAVLRFGWAPDRAAAAR